MPWSPQSTSWFEKPVSFHKNQRNWSGPVSPVFGKPADEYQIFKKFEIIFLKKLELISRFLVKTKFKNLK
jgi:hypothetical protein